MAKCCCAGVFLLLLAAPGLGGEVRGAQAFEDVGAEAASHREAEPLAIEFGNLSGSSA